MIDEITTQGVGMAGQNPMLVLVHGAAHGVWARDRPIGEMQDPEAHTVALPSARLEEAA